MGLGCGNPRAIASIQPGETVLDLGSGGGFDCFLAAKKVGDEGRVIGVDMTPEMLAKARDGFNHSKAMTFGTYGANLRISDDAASRIQENCIRCHESLVSQMVENAQRYSRTGSHVRGGRMCWDCHRGVPHGITRNLSATQTNFIQN